MCIRDSKKNNVTLLSGFNRIDQNQYINACDIGLVSLNQGCLLYTSDAADERSSVDLGGRRIIKKQKKSLTI